MLSANQALTSLRFDESSEAIEFTPIIVIAGMIGSGKTTMADILCEFLDAQHIQTDQLRFKTMQQQFNQGFFSEDSRIAKYEMMFALAKQMLADGEAKHIILDATFDKKMRLMLKENFASNEYCIIHMVVDDEAEAEQRLNERERQHRLLASRGLGANKTVATFEHRQSYQQVYQAPKAYGHNIKAISNNERLLQYPYESETIFNIRKKMHFLKLLMPHFTDVQQALKVFEMRTGYGTISSI